MKPLAPHFVDLTKTAAWKAFWRRDALKTFLRQHGIKETELSTWEEGESKIQYLDRLFDKLIGIKDGQGYLVIFEMAKSLSQMVHFPDLERREDTKSMIAEAKEAVKRLKEQYTNHIQTVRNEKEIQQRRKEGAEQRLESIQKQQSLEKLDAEIKALMPEMGTQAGGYKFEKWFYQLAKFFDIDASPSYKDSNGRQIDGSLTLDGTTFLVEAKFTSFLTETTDIDSLLSKINRKADNTMGIMVSMSGFDTGAKDNASRDRTPIILLDHSHLYGYVLNGMMPLSDVIRRVWRHASQTGHAYLPAQDFSR